jgi:SEC-C motif domain protein
VEFFTLCPCKSGQAYDRCCSPYHHGKDPENALALMRSRYSAYALELADYIIRTTHPTNPDYRSNLETWKKEILHFCQNTDFLNLKIHEFIDGENVAYVTFTAFLKQKGQDLSFKEKSLFLKEEQKWFYKSGEFFPVDP